MLGIRFFLLTLFLFSCQVSRGLAAETYPSREQDLPAVLPRQKFIEVRNIHNDLAKDARIVRVVKSCSCVEIVLSSEFLKPGETAKVEIAISAPVLLGPEQIEVSYDLETADQVDSRKIKISFFVTDYLSTSQRGVDLDAASSSGTVIYKRGVHPDRWNRAVFEPIKSSLGLRSDLVPLKDSKDWTLQVGMDPSSAHVGACRLVGKIEYFWDKEKLPRETPVSLTVRRNSYVQASPSVVLIGAVPEGDIRSGKFILRVQSGNFPSTLSVSSSDPSRSLAKAGERDGSELPIEVVFTGLGPVGNHSGEIIVECDSIFVHIPYIASVGIRESLKKK